VHSDSCFRPGRGVIRGARRPCGAAGDVPGHVARAPGRVGGDRGGRLERSSRGKPVRKVAGLRRHAAALPDLVHPAARDDGASPARLDVRQRPHHPFLAGRAATGCATDR